MSTEEAPLTEKVHCDVVLIKFLTFELKSSLPVVNINLTGLYAIRSTSVFHFIFFHLIYVSLVLLDVERFSFLFSVALVSLQQNSCIFLRFVN